jgi:hypothetical protein
LHIKTGRIEDVPVNLTLTFLLDFSQRELIQDVNREPAKKTEVVVSLGLRANLQNLKWRVRIDKNFHIL